MDSETASSDSVHSEIFIDSDDDIIFQRVVENNDEVIYVEDVVGHQEPKPIPIVESTMVCPICMSTIADPSILSPCYHIFCLRCAVPWLQTKPSCPVCRRIVKSIIYRIQDRETYLEEPVFSLPSHESNGQIMQDNPNLHLNELISQSVTAGDGMQRRRQIYRNNLRLVNGPPVIAGVGELVKCRPISEWIQRDVQAILPNDANIEKLVSDLMRVILDPQRPEYVRIRFVHMTPFRTLCNRYLGRFSMRFIDELLGFALSGHTMARYDYATVYK
ncbi:E3 ubiquitin-protein ligase ICP0 [Thelohanellus kitauei]|uniref:RING-type E3 ubiquitin transferase n=1 Tax=Thelohanellus kitauei TaxID=669202 RepID=A0A0C2M5F9_THEKT|nr:E3 ubiquitin-protein ligase ICP0 [Thelohanellus kitauei]